MQRRRARRAAGFTLVEVLVALAIMAVISVMAWQGIDAMMRTRDASRDSLQRTLRLHAAVTQWEQDVRALYDTQVVPPRRFDGNRLLLTRESERGVQVVVWSVRDGGWWRWAGPPVTQVDQLQEQWMRSMQLIGNEPGTLRALDQVQSLVIADLRDGVLVNAQSSADAAAEAQAVATSVEGGASAAASGQALPEGMQLTLGTAGTTITRLVPVVLGGGS